MTEPLNGDLAPETKVEAKTYTYQQQRCYFAQVADGLEDLARIELLDWGALDIKPGFRGFHFQADHRTLYKIAYWARMIQKITAPLAVLDCHSTKYLYQRAKDIPWTDFLTPARTFAITANVSDSHIRHSQYATLCLKDAIADSFMDLCGERPSVDRDDPNVWFHLYIHNNRAVISLEVSGGSLHKRGYRIIGHEAPIQETVAAAIIRLAEWDGQQPLYDPMCGSGTLLCEALMHYCRIPAGYFRQRFGFESLPDHEAATWKAVQEEAKAQIRPLPDGLIGGSDISPEAIRAASANLAQLPSGAKVQLKTLDFRTIPGLDHTTIVSNPPHGIRMQKTEGIEAFCKDLGDFLKQRCKGSTAFLYFGNRELIKAIGLRTSWKKPLSSGGLDGRLVKLELY